MKQPRMKFGKKVAADLSRHATLMNVKRKESNFSVYLSSVIHGTINYLPCQNVFHSVSQMACRILGYFHINNLHCTFLFSGNLCVLGKK